mgnify:CR=1 FL=1
MTPNERTEFLSWLNRLDEPTLKEVQQHVNAALTFKRGAKLRLLSPGSQIVYELWMNGQGTQHVGTVVKLHKVSVVVELADGSRHGVGVDQILGLHIGRGAFSELSSSQPMPLPAFGGQPIPPQMPPEPPIFEYDFGAAEQRVAEQMIGPVVTGSFDPATEPPVCYICELPGSPELGPLEQTPNGPAHKLCARTAAHGND